MAELKCLVELNKEKGILIILKNPDEKIEQSIVADGTNVTITCKGQSDRTIIDMVCDKIVSTCKGSSDTSTIEQTSDTVTITSKNFNVVSDNVSIKAKQDLKTEATNTSIKSKDLKTDSPQTAINGKNVKISGDAQVAISGGVIKLQ